jgi:predicted nucleotide-binding protein (sugar kinase/HSP70/actin superfamily)
MQPIEFNLESVAEKPKVKKVRNHPYKTDPYINSFLDSKLKLAKIEILNGKSPQYLYNQITKRITIRGLNIKASVINNTLYLELVK